MWLDGGGGVSTILKTLNPLTNEDTAIDGTIVGLIKSNAPNLEIV